MSTSRFLKKLTAAEVGNTKTHEVYIRIPNDFDFKSFFNNSHVENGSVVEVNFNAIVSTKIIDTIAPQSYDLRFVYFANSNKEKRIPGLGPLFKAFNVEEGDVVCLEKKEDNSYSLTFLSPYTLQIYNGGLLWKEDFDDTPTQITPRINNLTLQQIFYGAPGTGKSYAIQAMIKKYGNDKAVRTTFHPDSDYASFVGAYKPTMQDLPMSYISEGIAKYAKKWDKHEGTEKKIVYKFVPQAFLKAYVKAWSDLDNPYFLVIEEINRGNCAQIFGDLFQLLDRNSQGASSYAIHADDDIRQFLANDENGLALRSESKPNGLTEEQRTIIASFVHYEDNGSSEAIGVQILSGELLLLPPNLHIWATMNTSDQSLFPIDSAFKRRWNWEYVPIEYDKKPWLFEAGGKLYRWGDFLSAINPIILKLTESTDKQMGFFFAKPDKKSDPAQNDNNVISQKVFVNKVLFYLWTDVLKDYEVNIEPFLVANSNPQRAYDFTDFFDKENDYLTEFICKEVLGLTPVSSEEELEEPNQQLIEPTEEYGTFIVNGKKLDYMNHAVQEVAKIYLENNLDKPIDDIVTEWSQVRLLSHALEDKARFDARTDQTKQRAVDEIVRSDGAIFYISNQLRPKHMDRLIAYAPVHWGINISRG